MRYVNEDLETIEKPENLYSGDYEFWETIGIKPEAIPPDNITKFVYHDDDYETVTVVRKISEFEKLRKSISIDKAFLSDTDYVVIKIMEGVATKEEYKDILQKREEARREINRNEAVLMSLS